MSAPEPEQALVRAIGPFALATNVINVTIGAGIFVLPATVAGLLGPAALNRAWTLVNDVRDTQQSERLRAVAGDAGCHACHTQGSCSERCPKQLMPTTAIAGLKRVTATAAVRGKL